MAADRLLLTAVGLLLLIAASGVDADTSRCPANSYFAHTYRYAYKEQCIQFIFSEVTWVRARDFCHGRGGVLLNTDTRHKYNWVVAKLNGPLSSVFDKNGFWLGLHDKATENRWLWDQGSNAADKRMSWSNWYPGEPNDLFGQDCVYMRRGYSWKWVDVGCGDGFHVGRTYSFACEFQMIPTTPAPTTTPTTPIATTPTTKLTTIPTTRLPTTVPTTTIPTTMTPTTTIPTTTVTTSTTSTSTTSTSTTSTPTTSTSTTSVPTTSVPTTSSPALTTIPTAPTTIPTAPSTANPTPTVATKLTTFATDKSTTVDPKHADDSGIFVPASNGKGSGTNSGHAPKTLANHGDEEDKKSETAGISIGVVVGLLAIIALLLLAFFYRRKRRKEDLPRSLANPCYVAGANDLNYVSEENEYASCYSSLDRGNVYVEPPTSDEPVKGPVLSFSNKRYAEAPTRPLNIDIASAENSANDQRADGNLKAAPNTKYLDEYGKYDENGYLYAKHIYADISDVCPPPLPAHPGHYDTIPEAKPNSQRSSESSTSESSDVNVYLYEDPHSLLPDDCKLNASYSNIPAQSRGHYDVPRSSVDVAEEYNTEATSEDQDPPADVAALYDTPRPDPEVVATEYCV